VLVVPLMEELFWRSFLLRYLIDQNFESVPVGSFTWPSFLVTTVLFGLEHHFLVAGMLAGAIYSLLLYRTRSLAQCVLAHAVTNLALAGYVLYTGNWYFW
jgi:CAAX prenyl protease-like protein